MLAMSQTRSVEAAVLWLLPAGVGWISSLSTLSALVQLAAPAHEKSRVLALYNVAFLAAWSIGSSIGGVLANDLGVRVTSSIAAVAVLAAAALAARLPLPTWDTQPVPSEPLTTPVPVSVR
jgi:predicted MFS family arabinose efflux permease